ncbi:hypothetical protein LTS02_001851 [Friedmanniomyces endolithicus]|nr:hypothetical protein LTS02_001851 [Friedmanniomyces endolithicus]
MAASADTDPVDDGSRLAGGLTETLPVMERTSHAQTPLVGSCESHGTAELEPGSSGAKEVEKEEKLQSQAVDGAASLGKPVPGRAVDDAVSHDVTQPPPKNRFPKSFQRFKRLPTASQYVSARRAAESVTNTGTTGRNMQIFRKPGLTNLGAYMPPRPPAPGA